MSRMPRRDAHVFALPAILALAAAVFSTGVLYGFPQELDADEGLFVVHAAKMLADGTLDPRWYGVPAQMLMYMLAALFALISVIGVAIGAFGSLSESGDLFLRDVTLFHAAGRALTVVASLLCIPVMWRILRALRVERSISYVALLIFCLSPLIVQYSSIIRGDMYQTLFNLVGVWFAIRALKQKHFFRDMIIAGACVGLALSNKFPGIIGATPVIGAAALLLARKQIALSKAALALLAAGAASIVAAFLTSPFLFINFEGVLGSVSSEARPSHLGHTSEGFGFALSYYFADALPSAMGWLGVVLALAGLTVLAPAAAREHGAILVALFFFAYAAFISSLNLYWERWAIPLVPFGAIGVALALSRIRQFITKPRLSLAASIAMPILVLAPIAYATSIDASARAANRDTRVRALNWIAENVPQGSTLLLEAFSPSPSIEQFDVRITSQNEIRSWSDTSGRLRPIANFGHHAEQWRGSVETFITAAREAGVEYVTISEWRDLYAAEAELYAREHAFYVELLERLPVIQSFEPAPGELGPPILLLGLN